MNRPRQPSVRWRQRCEYCPSFSSLLPRQCTLTQHRDYSKAKNLDELSKLGHFLKGSSATLGFTKVRDECEKIQHYGHKKNDTGEVDEPNEDKCLRLINESLAEAKRAYEAVNTLMKAYYAEGA